MLWRRWRKKANLKIFGNPITPFGPPWLDRMISTTCGLKGDFVPDFRLIDYLVAIMSTSTSPALNGHLHNSDRLKKDLSDLGVFDTKMSLYLLDKLREYESMGFSGFEGRHYSLFESFAADMGQAVGLQNLLYLLAFKYIASGRITHDHIPDDPFIESERRQIVFGAAIGIPTFFIRQDTGNEMMKRILEKTADVRASRRYPGYHRVRNLEYRRALLQVLREDAQDLIEMLHLDETLDDLAVRLNDPDRCAAIGKLTKGILQEGNVRSPFKLSADEFNQAAERFYRFELRSRHIREALMFFKEDAAQLDAPHVRQNQVIREALHEILKNRGISDFISLAEQDVLEGRASEETLEKVISLMVVAIFAEQHGGVSLSDSGNPQRLYAAPVH
jgi:predicted house-cleaning noncanonical NTP pyrophosphatase (MazG superfamily)